MSVVFVDLWNVFWLGVLVGAFIVYRMVRHDLQHMLDQLEKRQ